MIELAGIYTIRDTPHPYFWDVVYEWEDEFSKELGIPLIKVGEKYDQIYNPSLLRKVLNRVNFYVWKDRFMFKPKKYFIAFHIGPPGAYSFYNRKDVIPIIIDFWKFEDLRRFESICCLNKMVFVTSREVYNYLIAQNLKIKLNHLPLSLPDKIFISEIDGKKKYDVIQVGRQNEMLTQYVQLLIDEHPELNYVYSEKIDGKLVMKSTLNGTLGEFTSRESFLNLLRHANIALVSAPGMDSDMTRTGGFSPVTPRFMECAACGCHLVGIYPDNADFAFYGINHICKNITNYSEFKSEILKCLSGERRPAYISFLRNHLSSKRAKELLEKLSSEYVQ